MSVELAAAQAVPHPSRRAVLVGATAAATSVAAGLAVPRANGDAAMHKPLETLIPKVLGEWRYLTSTGVVASAENDDADMYDDLLTRIYEAPGHTPVMLLIAYGRTQGGSLQLHRPETCYPAQGFTLSESSPREIGLAGGNAVPARAFTAKRDDRVERLMYWTRIGDRFPLSSMQEYRAIFASVMRRTVPDGVLVRVSAIGPDTARSDATVDLFARTLINNSGEDARRLLVGDAMAAALARADLLAPA